MKKNQSRILKTTYKQGKGSVQFPLDQPIPYELIERIVKFRVIENQNRETIKAESLTTNSTRQHPMEQNTHIDPKAESLTTNSIGQRPMKRHTPTNPKPQRGAINSICKHN